jgi:hypothetical protein
MRVPELREGGEAMIDFNYTAPELLPFRIQEVLDAPSEPHRIGGVVYVPEGGGTLTAEDVLNAVYKHGSRWQAIADELNTTLRSDRESELKDSLNYVAGKWAIAQVQAADSARRCRLLEALVRDWQELYENPDYGECVRLIDRMRKLGIEVEQ